MGAGNTLEVPYPASRSPIWGGLPIVTGDCPDWGVLWVYAKLV